MTAAFAFQPTLPGVKRGKVADEYRFGFIKFGRDLYKFFAGEHANVAHLASLLGVTVYWGYDYFEVSQGRLGALLQTVCGVSSPPSRRSVSTYLKRLEQLGYIRIPRKRSLTSVKSYAFTDKFRALLDPEMRQKMWDTQLHGIEGRTSLTTVKLQSIVNSQDPVVITNKNRAINTTMTKEPETADLQPHRAQLIEKKDRSEKPEKTATKPVSAKPMPKPRQNNHRPRPAKPRNGHRPARLTSFENSVRHWMFGFTGISTVAEAEILVALFLELNAENDPFVSQIRGNWNKAGGKGETMTDAERSYNVRCLVGHLRKVKSDRTAPPPPVIEMTDPEPEPEPVEMPRRVAKLEQDFHCALIFGQADYTGPGEEIIKRFRTATEGEREQILADLHSGKLRPI